MYVFALKLSRSSNLFVEALKVVKELIDLSLNTLINTNLVNNEINYTQFKVTFVKLVYKPLLKKVQY